MENCENSEKGQACENINQIQIIKESWKNQFIQYQMNFNQNNFVPPNNFHQGGTISPTHVIRDKSIKQFSPDCNSIEVYNGNSKIVVTGGDRLPYKNQQSRSKFPHPSSSTNWQKDQSSNDHSLNNSLLNVASQSQIGNKTTLQNINSRSPIIGTRLGKIIMAAKGQSQNRSNFFVMQPQLAYENNLVDDFELMKNVQHLIEENAHRCVSQITYPRGSNTTNSSSIPENHYLPSQITSDNSFRFSNFMKKTETNSNNNTNLFASAFEPIKQVQSRLQQEVIQKQKVNLPTSNQSPPYIDQIKQAMNPPPRKTNVFRLVHNNNTKYAKIRNEIDQMLNMHHQRYSSASPQQNQSNAIFDERNKYVQEYLNDNLFSQQYASNIHNQLNIKGSQVESIGRIL